MNRALIDHLERFLGPIEYAWTDPIKITDIKALRFRPSSIPGTIVQSTLGLSSQPLPMHKGRAVRQELLVCSSHEAESEHLASFLITFADYVKTHGCALLAGQVVGPADPIIPGCKMNSVYIAVPGIFPETFRTFTGSEPPTIFAWVIPIYESEASFVTKFGWNEFETRMEKLDPDLLDLHRKSFL